MSAMKSAPAPFVVTVNLDVESVDAANAGAAGLFGRYSYGRYGAREGVRRYLEIFARRGVRATFFVSADDARRHEALIRTIMSEGHEIALQASPVSAQTPRGPAALDALAAGADALAWIIGERPRGFRATNGLLTRDVLVALAELGFVYDSSFQDDDAPYVFDAGDGRRLVELPVFDYLTDATFYGGRHTPQRVEIAFGEEAWAQADAGGYIHLTLHSRGDVGSARAVRAAVVDRLLARAVADPAIVLTSLDDLCAATQAKALPEPIPDWGPEM